MSGVKGKSGRRTLLNEKTTEEICSLSQELLLQWLNNKEVDITRKIAVAKEIFLKRMPTKLEGKGFDTDIYNFITGVRQTFQESNTKSLGLDKGNGLDKGRT